MQRMQRTKNESIESPDSSEQVAASKGVDLGLELTKGFAAKFIRHKANQLSRRPEFSRSDVDDIAQDLTMRLLQSISQFDPQLARFDGFVTTLIERFVANIIREASAQKRDRSSTESLHTIVGEDECGPVELVATISGEESGLPSVRFEDQEVLETVIDVRDTLEQLSPEDRELCERLKHQSNFRNLARDGRASNDAV